ncbi:MAG: tRNA (N6-isopentenyl adenosine(37)-C2)-methylthiotransferase MiaB [Alphaproteobacteria bacterium]|nr:MAG: tRNA (N6-isopentenyl adenosine(37)-C2)-methylthiotransferase MiaB [Alphaproteobacteria bacterium]
MTSPKKVCIKTYGCQMQVYDSDRMLSLLKPFGYTQTEDPTEANLIILNTCNIREKAEQKIFSELGRIREYKKAQEAQGQEYLIAVGGCVAQAQGDEIVRQAPYVSVVFGPQNYHRLPEYLTKVRRESSWRSPEGVAAIQNGSPHRCAPRDDVPVRKHHVDVEFPVESKFDYIPAVSETKASAFLTIQEGCNKFCHFCVVPYTRGAEYSRPVKAIIEEAKHLVGLGAKEITLLGQNVSDYHGDDEKGNPASLAVLLETVAKELPELKRLRYTTSHPRDITDHLIECHGSLPQLMPYLHLPVQTGSDKMLKAMNRKHTIDLYYGLMEKFRKARPDIMVSSDFIVGYPGETQEDHKQTLQLVQDCIDVGYSFNYSVRPGTPASVLDQVPEDVKTPRLYELQDLLRMKQLLAHQKQVGLVNEVLVEKKGKEPGQLIGKNPHLQSVYFDGDESLIGEIVPVKILAAYQNSLHGELIEA